jgi:hypothetical protein
MSNFGYFSEIQQLKKKIKELEIQIEYERQEHRDIYMKLKNNHDNVYIMSLKEDVNLLRAENQRLILRNNTLEQEVSKTTL